MPFGRSVTTFLADFLPDDYVAPQVTADFVRALPPNPVKGDAVSTFVHELIPNDPAQPAGLGSNLSEFLSIFRNEGDGGAGLGDGGSLNQDNTLPDNSFVPPLSDYFVFG